MKITILSIAIIAYSWQCFAQTNYFPAGSLDHRANIQWYSKHLSVMQEPALPTMTNTQTAECYRFLYLPTWGNSFAVRLTASGEVFSIHSTILSRAGGYEPGTISNQYNMVLSKKDTDDLRKQIEKVGFFEMPKTNDTPGGRDGERWILEGVKTGRYHVVDRWCPANYDTKKRGLEAFVTLCRRLMDFSTDKNKANKASEAIAPQSGAQPQR